MHFFFLVLVLRLLGSHRGLRRHVGHGHEQQHRHHRITHVRWVGKTKNRLVRTSVKITPNWISLTGPFATSHSINDMHHWLLHSGVISGVLFALFSGQPLIILGSTGPVFVYEKILHEICMEQVIEYVITRGQLLIALGMGLLVSAPLDWHLGWHHFADIGGSGRFISRLLHHQVCAIHNAQWASLSLHQLTIA